MEPRQRLWSVCFPDVFLVLRLFGKLLRKEERREGREDRRESGREERRNEGLHFVGSPKYYN